MGRGMIKVGKPDVDVDSLGHTPGVKSGNSEGNYESQKGHNPDGTRTAQASTGVDAKARDPIDDSMPNLSPGQLEASVPIAPAVPELSFSIEDGGVLDPAAVPTLRFGLRVDATGPVRSLALNVQVRIAATRRRYDEGEEQSLAELFGRPEEWSRNLKSLHWANASLQVPAFEGSTVIDLPLTCTYDLEVTATRYMHALGDGDVPLEFLFGGSLFYPGPDGGLQVRPIGWDQEAGYRLPVSVWRQMMDRHFPGSAWLRLNRDAFERLHAYRARNALLIWDETIAALLREAE